MVQKFKDRIRVLCLMFYLDVNFKTAKNMVKLYNIMKHDRD
jgi:hypothetical protein